MSYAFENIILIQLKYLPRVSFSLQYIYFTLIQRYDKNHFISVKRDQLKFYRLSGATFYDRINSIYQFIKPFLDNRMSIFF